MTTRSRHVEVAGVRIHFLDSGDDGTGRPPIVFAPGVTDIADDYHAILPELGRRSLIVDFRGRGASESPDRGYSMDDHVADITAVVDAVTDGPVHLMTFSRGSCYAIGWALANPHRVRSIAIGDYPVREIAFPEAEEFVVDFMCRTWRGTPVTDRITEKAFRGILDEAVARSFWPELAALEVPVMVVRAGSCGPISDDDWAQYERWFPGIDRHEFAESPHDIFRPDRFRYPRLVRAHVDAADQGSAAH